MLKLTQEEKYAAILLAMSTMPEMARTKILDARKYLEKMKTLGAGPAAMARQYEHDLDFEIGFIIPLRKGGKPKTASAIFTSGSLLCVEIKFAYEGIIAKQNKKVSKTAATLHPNHELIEAAKPLIDSGIALAKEIQSVVAKQKHDPIYESIDQLTSRYYEEIEAAKETLDSFAKDPLNFDEDPTEPAMAMLMHSQQLIVTLHTWLEEEKN